MAEQLKNIIKAGSRPTNLSSDILESESNTHLDDGSTSIDKGFLVSGSHNFRLLSTAANVMLMGSDSCSSIAVKSKADKGEACQTTDESSLGTKSNTHQDGGSTRRYRKGKGKKNRRTSQSNIYVDEGSPGKPFLAKVDFFGAVKSSKVVKVRKLETCQTTESNTHQDDGSKTTTTDSGWADSESSQEGKGETCERTDVCSPDPESNTLQDDGSTASAAVLGGEFNCLTTTEGEGVSSQKIKIGIAGPESNTHLDDGSTLTDKGFLVSENNTCHVDVSTTTDGIVNEAISKDWEGQTTDESFLGTKSITHQDDGSTAPVLGGEFNSTMEGQAERAFMESLPLDIVQDILYRVPAESVLACKLVCKNWVTLIRESSFANTHLTRRLNQLQDGNDDIADTKVESCLFFAGRTDNFKTLLFHGGQLSDKKYIYNQNLKRIYHPPMHNEPLHDHLVGSCNGLVCALQKHHLILDPIYICNPLTREYVHLPQLVVKEEDVDPDLLEEGEVDMYGRLAYGFGYVRSTNEYKVVRIHYLDVYYAEGNVEVYTLGSGYGWRAIGRISYRLEGGTYANDAIYWISYKEVVVFDLAKEEFRLLSSVPPCLQNRQNGDRCGLVVLGRHVCFYMDKSRVEIWSLTKNNDSWFLEFDIDHKAVVDSRPLRRRFQPILLTTNGEIIFLYAKSALYCYDTKTTFLKIISNEATTDYFYDVEAIAHLNTFVSLEAMGENSKRYAVRPRRVRTPWDDVIDELDRVALGEEVDTTRFRLR